MIKIRIGHQILLLIILAFVSGCNDRVKFGTGRSSEDGGNNPSPTPTLPNSTFAGLNSIGNKTDSTATLYWAPHADAVNYLVYDTTSGSPVLLQTISNPTANSLTLTGLTADATYKFRVRMENASSEIDTNTTELSVTMNHAPQVPTTPAFHTPATSPGTVNKPTLTVNGVKAGDIVKIFTDNCSTEVASGTVASGQTSINLQVSNNLTVNTYFFYANSTNAQGHSSSCTAGLSYELAQPNCPTDYIQVLANTSLGVNNDFCVAKYEMKNVSSVATSQAPGSPWVSITATNAWNTCLALNSESNNTDKLADSNHDGTYALISNAEWMTIARSIEDESSNWVGGVLNSGWAASTSYGDSYTHSAVAPQTNTNCLYSSAANTCASTGDHKFKRTHKLKNGEEIWDLSGNVYERTDWSSSDSFFTLGPTSCSASWQELNVVNCPELSVDSYMPLITSNTSTQNIGLFYGGSGGAALRGGAWNFGSLAGPFLLGLNLSDGYSGADIGFRCVFRP